MQAPDQQRSRRALHSSGTQRLGSRPSILSAIKRSHSAQSRSLVRETLRFLVNQPIGRVDFQPQRNNLSEQRVSAVSETAGRHRKGPPAHVPAGVGFVAGRRDESEGHAPPTRRALLPDSARRVPRTRFGCPRRVTPPTAPHPYRRGRAPRTPASGRARRARATPHRTRP